MSERLCTKARLHGAGDPCVGGCEPAEVPAESADMWRRWHAGELARWADVHALLRMVDELRAKLAEAETCNANLVSQAADLTDRAEAAEARVRELATQVAAMGARR